MIGVLAAAAAAASAWQPTPADRFDMSCVEAAGFVMATHSDADTRNDAFALSSFYLGRLSARNPLGEWRAFLKAELDHLNGDPDYEGKVYLNCVPTFGEAVSFSK